MNTSSESTIVVDAMACPIGLNELVAVSLHLQKETGVSVCLVGHRGQLEDAIASRSVPLSALEIVHAERMIGLREHGPRALKIKQNTSVQVAVSTAKSRVAPLISFGNATALSLLIAEHLSPSERLCPQAIQLESGRGPMTLLDVGPTEAQTAKQLLECALMGTVYHQVTNEQPNPTVGLLVPQVHTANCSVREREAHRLLHDHCPNYIGVVSGLTFLSDPPDVAVAGAALGGFLGQLLRNDTLTEHAKRPNLSSRLWHLARFGRPKSTHTSSQRWRSSVHLGASSVVYSHLNPTTVSDVLCTFRDALALHQTNCVAQIDAVRSETLIDNIRTTTERPAFKA